jgi:hypothetical protein
MKVKQVPPKDPGFLKKTSKTFVPKSKFKHHEVGDAAIAAKQVRHRRLEEQEALLEDDEDYKEFERYIK